jgi:hypothetical protein
VSEPAPAQEEKLPATASPFAAIGLAGLFSLAAGVALRLALHRTS